MSARLNHILNWILLGIACLVFGCLIASSYIAFSGAFETPIPQAPKPSQYRAAPDSDDRSSQQLGAMRQWQQNQDKITSDTADWIKELSTLVAAHSDRITKLESMQQSQGEKLDDIVGLSKWIIGCLVTLMGNLLLTLVGRVARMTGIKVRS